MVNDDINKTNIKGHQLDKRQNTHNVGSSPFVGRHMKQVFILGTNPLSVEQLLRVSYNNKTDLTLKCIGQYIIQTPYAPIKYMLYNNYHSRGKPTVIITDNSMTDSRYYSMK